MGRFRTLAPAHWWDRLVASDPALERFRLATRVVLAAIAATLVLSALAGWAHQPTSAALVGVSVATTSIMAVNDPSPRSQRRTMLLMPLPAALAIALGTLVAPHPWLGAAAFLLVIFLAVAARRFGPRGMALGMIAFFTFFFSLFFRAALPQVPWMVAGVVLATGLAYAVRFWLVRDRPDRMLRQSVAAFRSAAALVLHTLAGVARAPRWSGGLGRTLQRPLARLNESALGLEALLDRAPPDALGPGLTAREVRRHVFELELAVERAVAAVREGLASGTLPEAARPAVAEALLAARQAVRSGAGEAEAGARAALARARAAAPAPDSTPEGHALHRLELTLRDVLAASAWLWAPRPDGHRLEEAPGAPEEAEEAEGPRPEAPAEARRGLHPSTRQAIQATVAGALAMLLGRWVSDTRWTWAVVAAFVVFTRTQTRGETLVRAWQRTLGTVAGVTAGMLLAALVHGHARLELALLFVCLWFAYYLIRVSYGWMVVCFTAVLAILYSLLGRYSPALLWLRLAETLLGAGAAALVSVVLLPVRTGQRVRKAMADILRELGDYLAYATSPRAGAGAPLGLLDRTRELDAKLRELRNAASPLTANPLRLAPELAHAVHAASAAAFFARHLAVADGLAALQEPARSAVEEAVARLAQRAATLADALEGKPVPVPPAPAAALVRARDALAPTHALPRTRTDPLVALHWLECVDGALGELDEAVRAESPARPQG